jgi:hypothetical protein
MRNYIVLGPVRLRISSRHLAPWGYSRLIIGGLNLFSRANTGDLILASYHPDWSHTWRWSIMLKRADGRGWVARDPVRRGQWHDYYRLPFGWQLLVSQQNYLPKRSKSPEDASA